MGETIFAKRRSVRQFLPDAVPDDAIEQILRAATEAPSAGNRQPWHFYVVRRPALKEQLCAAAWSQAFIAQAPVVLVVCAEPARSAERYAERGEALYCLQDTAAAVQNMLLCAAQLGYGSCWCGAFDEAVAAQAMALPAGQRPVAIIPLGLPAKGGKQPARRSLREVVTYLD